jgi:hypothetical protein
MLDVTEKKKEREREEWRQQKCIYSERSQDKTK